MEHTSSNTVSAWMCRTAVAVAVLGLLAGYVAVTVASYSPYR